MNKADPVGFTVRKTVAQTGNYKLVSALEKTSIPWKSDLVCRSGKASGKRQHVS